MDKNIIDGGENNIIDNSTDSNTNETSKMDNSQDKQDKDIDYEKRYSDSSREAKHIAQVHKSYRQVLKNNSVLLDLDKNLAKDVVSQLYEDGLSDTDSLEDIIDFIKNGSTDIPTDNISQKKVDEKEIVKRVRQEMMDEESTKKANEALDNALDKFDDDTKKKYRQEFEELLGNRKITPDFAKKEIEKIILFYSKDDLKKQRSDEALSKLASNGLKKGEKGESTKMTKEKLRSLGMNESKQRKLYPELFTK